MPVSKTHIKLIQSLAVRKFRRKESLFVAEGPKCVGDLLAASMQPRLVIATEGWAGATTAPCEVVRATDEELRRASLLQHPQEVIGVFQLPGDEWLPQGARPLVESVGEELVVCLDGVQDPGNVGTIIRTADWFGVRHIVCGLDCADAFSPKVVQATMGSIARVKVTQRTAADFLRSVPKGVPIYGMTLDGEDLYSRGLSAGGVVVMGNEGNGISPAVRPLVSDQLLIPSFAPNGGAESLNVSVAAAVVMSEIRRRRP